MTPEIATVLIILLLAVILFVNGRLRMDLIALLVLAALVLTRLVTPIEALSGFSSPAVVTVWAVFILSGGLARTGMADIVGDQVSRLSGRSEAKLIVVIMLTAAFLSAFMNNVAVVAMLLPVVLTLARKKKFSPSRLLMPLAFGCLLGGLITQIGTPPNILVSDALRDIGLQSFQFFDFAPMGIILMLVGIAFMVFVGRRLLPDRHPAQSLSEQQNGLVETMHLYGLEERLALVTIPDSSQLAGKTLAESHIGRVLGLTILGLQRLGRKKMTIEPDTVLSDNDILLALGRLDRLETLTSKPYLLIEDDEAQADWLFSLEYGLAELAITSDSPFIDKTISQIDFRKRYGFHVLAIQRQDQIFHTHLQDFQIRKEDMLLMYGDRASIIAARLVQEFHGGLNIFVEDRETAVKYHLQEKLLVVRIPLDSPLVGQSLAESHLGELFDLEALSITHDGQTILVPPADTHLHAEDVLLVEGRPEDLNIVRGLQGLVIKRHLHMDRVELESESVGLVEAILSPHTTLVNKTLRDIHFREKYQLSVLAIWRNGRAYRSALGDMPLQFGDAFLIYGPREKLNLLEREPDFLMLQESTQEPPRRQKAWLAAIIMLAVVISVLVGWLPIAIAAVIGSALMVLTGCLNMEEAYQYIDWRAVFLIACMLPLGIAMEQTGTAQFLAEGLISTVSGFGGTAVLAGIFLLTSVASQFMPNPVVTVLMIPIGLNTANDLQLSPYALMMVVAIAASASFMSPVSHPANVLIMGPGGYRFNDYVKVGLPLTLVIMVVTLLVLPLVWPLRP